VRKKEGSNIEKTSYCLRGSSRTVRRKRGVTARGCGQYDYPDELQPTTERVYSPSMRQGKGPTWVAGPKGGEEAAHKQMSGETGN